MFETVKLSDEYLDLFAHLDPYSFLEYGKLSDRVCLGTVQKGDKEKKDRPVALLICRLAKRALVVEWIFVEGDFRLQGCGARLMRCVFEEAKLRGFEKVYAYLAIGNKREKICPGEERFMEEYNLKMVKPGKGTKALFEKIIPKELMGSYLYCADVEGYFEKMLEKEETEDFLLVE